uniref:Putative secreted peptide n=1 Tax=Anopheles braziliensis TaxID=58242 RepID=A0A2M3ZRQ4_9DIPT
MLPLLLLLLQQGYSFDLCVLVVWLNLRALLQLRFTYSDCVCKFYEFLFLFNYYFRHLSTLCHFRALCGTYPRAHHVISDTCLLRCA